MALEAGTWIDGRYKILRFLGKGREGSVYLAFQEKLFRFYAVKELSKDGICFSRESIEVWKTLHCEGLPEIVDILENENTVWIVSEYVEGISLQEYMEKSRTVSSAQAAWWCLQIADVMKYLHGQNPPIAYGDLKPDNLMIQKNRIVMVDMGSLIRQGSRGKRTGTKEYTNPDTDWSREEAVQQDCYSLGRLSLILGRFCGCRQIEKAAHKMLDNPEKGDGRARKVWKWIRNQNRIYRLMFALTAVILVGMASYCKKQVCQMITTEDIKSSTQMIQTLADKQKEEAVIQMIKNHPGEKEGYLELLHLFQEDMVMNEEEELCYRRIWKEPLPGSEKTCGEYLEKNPDQYLEVAYESGITYWYFYRGLQGKKYASNWFRKVMEVPEIVHRNDRMRKNSQIYEKLGEYRERCKRYDETGEKGELFQEYWKDCQNLWKEQQEQITMVRLMLWKETFVSWKHYMVEMQEAGITEKEIRQILEQALRETDRVPEEHQRMQDISGQLKRDAEEIDGIIKRIYQDNTGKGEDADE